MFCKALFAAVALGASMASARIGGFYVPSTVQAGHKANVLLASQGYSQSVLDVSTAWSVGQDLYQDTLGSNVQDMYLLGREKSNLGNTNITQQISIPEDLAAGTEIMVALALTSVYGASGGPVIGYGAATIKVGESTSDEMVFVDGLPSTC